MPTDRQPIDQETADNLKAVCQRWAARYSWDDMVDQILVVLAAAAYVCKNRMRSMAELTEVTNRLLGGHLMILRELQNGNYYGYTIGPNAQRKQMDRIWAAVGQTKQAFIDRHSDQSPQAKLAEAQLSARHIKGVTQNPEWARPKKTRSRKDNFPRLSDFPEANNFAKTESWERLHSFVTSDVLGVKRKLAWDEWDGRLSYLEVVDLLAGNQQNPWGLHGSTPLTYIRGAFTCEERRQQIEVEVQQKEMDLVGEDDFFDVLLNTGTRRNAAHRAESDVIASIDRQRGMVPSVDLNHSIATLPLPPDQLRAIKAKIDGFTLQSPATAKHLGWTVARLERVRRSLLPDQKWGKVIREHLAAYNPAQKPQ